MQMDEARRNLSQAKGQAGGSTLRNDFIKKFTDQLTEVQKAVNELGTACKDQIDTWGAAKSVRDAAEIEAKANEGIQKSKEEAKDMIEN